MPDDWSDEETFDPLYADDRNFYKGEKWTFDGAKGIAFSTPATILGARKKSSPRPYGTGPVFG
jgi:hypothetical protein